MHPMFVMLFLEDDADELLADEEKRRRGRARRNRSAMVTRPAARDRGRRLQPCGSRVRAQAS
jgi:hypothetical protein